MSEKHEKEWTELEAKNRESEIKALEQKQLTALNYERFLATGVDLENRTLYINESIVTDRMASQVIKAMVVLDKADSKKPISMLMNCVGGDEYSGLAIYDAIKSCKSHTRIIVYGQAFSMGAWILQAAKERLMTPFSKLMIHMGYIGLAPNHPEINKRWMDQWAKDEKIFENILLERMRKRDAKITREDIKKALVFDSIYTAEESVKIGLADDIFRGSLADI